MIDNEITFRKLEIFLAFMEHRNIMRVSELLNLSTVSVHRALHSLEENIQCPLLSHQGRKLEPLPSAMIFADYAKNVITLTENAITAARASAGFDQNKIILGTIYSLTIETVPNLLMGLKFRRPNIKIDMVMGSNQELLTKLNKQEVNAILISISPATLASKDYEVLPIFEDDIFLVTPIDSSVSDSEPIDLRTLKGEKFVSLTEGFETYNLFKEAFLQAKFTPDVTTSVNDIFSLVNLVQGGVGYTLLPQRVKVLYGNRIKWIPLNKDYQMKQTIGLVLQKNHEYNPVLLALMAECRMFRRKVKTVSSIFPEQVPKRRPV